MPLTIVCGSCSSKVQAPDHLAGRMARCPHCKADLAIPEPSDSSARSADSNVRPRREEGSAPSRSSRRAHRSRDDDERDTDEAAPTGSSAVIIGGAVAGVAVLLLGGAVTAWVLTRPTAPPAQPQPPVAAAPADPMPPPQPAPAPVAPGTRPSEPVDASHDADTLAGILELDYLERKLRGKRYEVTGVVVGSASGQPQRAVELRGPPPSWGCMICEFRPSEAAKADALRGGQPVTIRGRHEVRITESALGVRCPILSDCTLEKAGEAPPPTKPITLPTGWLDAAASARLGDLEVRLKAVEVTAVEVTVKGPLTPGITRAADRAECLVVRLSVKNVGTATTFFRKPHGPVGSAFGVGVTDDRGTDFPPALPLQQAPRANNRFSLVELSAGQEVEDTLLFDPQRLVKVGDLRIDLPVNSFHPESAPTDPGGKRRVGFQVAQKAIPRPRLPHEPDPETAEKVAGLVKKMKSKKASERIQAAEALGGIGLTARAGCRALGDALFDPTPAVRVAAQEAMKKVHPELYQQIKGMLANATDYQYSTELLEIAAMGPEGAGAAPVLAAFMTANAPKGFLFRDGPLVVKALASVAADDEAAANLVATWLRSHSDPNTRLAAAIALAKMKGVASNKAARTALNAAKSDSSPAVREAAQATLEKLGP